MIGDDTFMAIAALVGDNSTCSRAKVGAIITQNRRIVSTGYNGAPSGMAHCEHSEDDGKCERAVHAEANAIAFSARHGTPLEDAVLYTTLSPCVPCAQLIVNAGIKEVICGEWYREHSGINLLENCGVTVRWYYVDWVRRNDGPLMRALSATPVDL